MEKPLEQRKKTRKLNPAMESGIFEQGHTGEK